MKDRYFYVLTALLAGAIVYFALSFDNAARRPNVQDIIAQGYHLSGTDLSYLTAAPGTSFDLIEQDGFAPYAMLRAFQTREEAGASPGVLASLSPIYDKAFSGQNLRITIRARRGSPPSTPLLHAAYFTPEKNGEWHMFELSPEYKDYSFTFAAPPVSDTTGYHYLGIWPDMEGKNRTLDVQSLHVEVLP